MTKSKNISIRLTEEELRYLRIAAAQAERTLSEHVRDILLPILSASPEQIPYGQDGLCYRTEHLNIRLTPNEKSWIKKCSLWFKCTPSEAARRILFAEHAFDPIILDTSLLDKAYLEVHRQGVNLNQLMAYLNTYKTNADTRQVQSVLSKVGQALDHLDAVTGDLSEQKGTARKGIKQ